MPMRPKRPCAHPGCPELVAEGKYCDKHRALHPEETRSASGRGYGRAWQKASKQFFAAHPLCAQCLEEGRYTRATVVDHIQPHRGDRVLFWDRTNRQGLQLPRQLRGCAQPSGDKGYNPNGCGHSRSSASDGERSAWEAWTIHQKDQRLQRGD